MIEQTTDIARIRTLAGHCYMDAYKAIHTEEQNLFSFEEMYSEESLRQQLDVQQSRFLILTEEGRDVGYISFYQLTSHRWMLDKLYLLPSCKGRGYGRKLYEAAVNEIRKIEHGSFFIELKVNRRNAAVTFYQHLGFSIVDSWDIPIADGRWVMDGYTMEKQYPGISCI